MTTLLKTIIERLELCNIECAQAEAMIIMESLTGISRMEIELQPLHALPPERHQELELILARRAKREPLQYILGKAPFMDIELLVTPATLIPRPETELLVEHIIKALPPRGRLLDLGTGSGAIAIAVAHARPDADVMALDISEDALQVAKHNAKLYNVNIEFVESDLFSEISSVFKFDFIAANLPYVSEHEYSKCAPEIVNYEPKLALVAPDNGLALIRRAADGALLYLKPGGELGLEIGYEQGNLVADYLKKAGFEKVSIVPDYNRFDRIVLGYTPKNM